MLTDIAEFYCAGDYPDPGSVSIVRFRSPAFDVSYQKTCARHAT